MSYITELNKDSIERQVFEALDAHLKSRGLLDTSKPFNTQSPDKALDISVKLQVIWQEIEQGLPSKHAGLGWNHAYTILQAALEEILPVVDMAAISNVGPATPKLLLLPLTPSVGYDSVDLDWQMNWLYNVMKIAGLYSALSNPKVHLNAIYTKHTYDILTDLRYTGAVEDYTENKKIFSTKIHDYICNIFDNLAFPLEHIRTIYAFNGDASSAITFHHTLEQDLLNTECRFFRNSCEIVDSTAALMLQHAQPAETINDMRAILAGTLYDDIGAAQVQTESTDLLNH